MASPVRRLIAETYALNDEDKAILRAELDDDADTGSPEEIEAAWRQELQLRVEQIERGEVELIDGEESFRRLLAKFDPK